MKNCPVPYKVSHQRPLHSRSDWNGPTACACHVVFAHFPNVNFIRLKYTLAGVMDGIGINDGNEFGELRATRSGGYWQRHWVLKGCDGP